MKPVLKAALEHYFKSYTTAKECFVASDNTIFHKQDDAVAYAANTLKNGDVANYTREFVEGGAAVAEVPDAATDNKAESATEPEAEQPAAPKKPAAKKAVKK